MKLAADDAQSVVIAGTGPLGRRDGSGQILAALTAFLAPYRDRGESQVDGY
jgi:hypothetical protein